MKNTIRIAAIMNACVLLVLCGFAPDASSHGGGNWNAFRIDTVNDGARTQLLDVQRRVSEIIVGRAGKDEWPPGDFRELRDNLITVKEEVDEVIEHYVIDGVNVQDPSQLHAEPRSGRTVAASRALDAGIALVERALSLGSADEMSKEFYAAGMTAKLYELLEAHVDRAALYQALTLPDN